MTAKQIFACVVVCGFVIAGCITSPAYKSLYAVGHAVDDATDTYFNLVAAGKVRTNDVPKVSRVYEEFQSAYRAALRAAQNDGNAKPDTNIVARVKVVMSVITAAQRETQERTP